MKLTKTLFAETKFLYLSCRNLNYINLVSAKSVSTYDIVNSNMLLFDKASVEFLNESLQ
jgi:ribosomal protein L4